MLSKSFFFNIVNTDIIQLSFQRNGNAIFQTETKIFLDSCNYVHRYFQLELSLEIKDKRQI